MSDDDTRVVAEGQSTDYPTASAGGDAPRQTAEVPKVGKPKQSRAFSFVSILLLLTILGAGVLAYFWMQERLNADIQRMQYLSSQETVASLRKQVSDLKSDKVTSETSDADLLAAELEASMNANVDYVKSGYTSKSTKIGKDFARVAVKAGTEEFSVVFKKVNSQWVEVYRGNGAVPAETIKTFAIPIEYQSGS